jgi:hypothetical protein
MVVLAGTLKTMFFFCLASAASRAFSCVPDGSFDLPYVAGSYALR